MDTNTLTNTEIYGSKQISAQELLDYADKGLSYREIGKLVGCSHVNVFTRLKALDYSQDELKQVKSGKSDVLHMISKGLWDEVLRRINAGGLKDESFHSLIVDIGIIMDKILALEGKNNGSNSSAIQINFNFDKDQLPDAIDVTQADDDTGGG